MTPRGRGQGHVSYFWSNGTDTRVPQNVFLVSAMTRLLISCIAYIKWHSWIIPPPVGDVGYSIERFRVCVCVWCMRYKMNKKLIRRWDSQTWLDDIGGDMPDSPVYLATLEESHSHTPIREICSEGVIPLDDLLQKISPKSYTPWVGCTHVTDDRQTEDRRQTDGFAMPLAKRNVVTLG